MSIKRIINGAVRMIVTELYSRYVDSIYLPKDTKYKEKDGYIWLTANHRGDSEYADYRVPSMRLEQDTKLLSVKYDKEEE